MCDADCQQEAHNSQNRKVHAKIILSDQETILESICHICGRPYTGLRCLACTQQSIDLMDFGAETLGSSSIETGVSGTPATDDSMAKLRLTNSEQLFVVMKPVCRIGMDPSNDIVLTGEPSIAKFHSQLVLEEKHYTLRDLGTKDGTWLNGEKVVIDATIYDGDQIKIGPYTFYFISDIPDEE